MPTLRQWWEEDWDRTQEYYNTSLWHNDAAQGHHQERDDLGADIADGINTDVLQELRTSVSGYIIVLAALHSYLAGAKLQNICVFWRSLNKCL